MVTKATSLGATFVAGLLAVTPAAAQNLVLRCAFPEPYNWEARLTIDQSARTMSVDMIDGGAITSFGFANVPAQIGEDRITATQRRGIEITQYTLNRYSGRLQQMADRGYGSGIQLSNACVPYQQGQRKY